MRKRKRLLASSAIVDVDAVYINDLADGSLIYNNVPKDEMFKLINPYSYKRNLKKISQVIAEKVVRFFIKKLVDHLMDSKRVLLSPEKTMYIGVMPKRRKGEYASRFLNLHTDGDIYGIKLTGVDMKRYHFKLAPARRKEL